LHPLPAVCSWHAVLCDAQLACTRWRQMHSTQTSCCALLSLQDAREARSEVSRLQARLRAAEAEKAEAASHLTQARALNDALQGQVRVRGTDAV